MRGLCEFWLFKARAQGATFDPTANIKDEENCSFLLNAAHTASMRE